MKKKWLLISSFLLMILSGCDNPLLIFDPKGPQAQTISDTILFSILMMAGILFVVYVLFAFMLVKYRSSKLAADYEPPHEEGSKWLEITWISIPIIIVVILSVVTVRSTVDVENTPKAYANEKPLIVYASSSNWKWHFSYPEEGIETVNYVNIPEDRPIEFKLYSYGPITSFWIPQLAGQKYAMSDMVTTIHLAADTPGSYMGKNSNFSGKDFAHMEFEAQVLTAKQYDEWVQDVKETAPMLTEAEFNHLLEPGILGRKTYRSTHLGFSPAPEGEHAGHQHEKNADMDMGTMHENDSTIHGEHQNN
ncbi:cytochrome aa3 quinol oxidase subunit II [Mammaliicoccus sciuri]|uniref:cytochrome aa3 quinol oxidase subunit II n=1 Tax=Sporosarcina aquimarina TaxID=114975 RepID=UPI001C8EF70C|nr:cytochrome aa3 quinol oxidase subunit II [Sporosarcina aquimarina]MBY0223105.1 cytochrome aa3 quinol oxidase subunit II [Sporosarcina aquimarina]